MKKRRLILIAIAVLLVSTACAEDNTAELQEPGIVGCVINKVYTAPSGATLTRLEPCSTTVDLPAGGKVATDSAGMGYADIDGCFIYIFQDGEIERSPCTESQETSGTCLKKNEAVWKGECKNKVITTETADLTLVGTWVWVTYLPEVGLTLVATLDGEVIAAPRTEDGALGQQSVVAEGEFWYTAPDDAAIAGVEPREPQPLELIPAVVDELQLTAWALSVERQAQLDGIDVPVQLAPGGSVNLTGGGGVLSDEDMADALLGGVDWDLVLGDAAVEGHVSTFLGSRPGIDVLDIPYDLERAEASVREVSGVDLTILADEESPTATTLAEVLVGSFEEMGVIVVDLLLTDLDNARQQMSSSVEEQQAALLVTGN